MVCQCGSVRSIFSSIDAVCGEMFINALTCKLGELVKFIISTADFMGKSLLGPEL